MAEQDSRLKVLLEMRPALAGHSGIPQETRLAFLGLNSLPGVSVDGLIQSSNRILARGLPVRARASLERNTEINRLSRVAISLGDTPHVLLRGRVGTTLDIATSGARLVLGQLLGLSHELTHFDPANFRDFIWQSMFAKTLHPRHREQVVKASYRVATVPWSALHRYGLMTRAVSGRARYPRLDTRGYDVMIAETPYPARVAPGTRMVVRYHDAIPMLMPHTISDTANHQASHYHALCSNVRDGAHFSCVSDATRADLLSIFPELEARSSTIPNMVSESYFPEESPKERVAEIVRTRRHPRPGEATPPPARGTASTRGAINYLLMVSTIEPRKNHLALLAAWERLRAAGHRRLKLVLVGEMGWNHDPIIRRCRPWLESGDVAMLGNVPTDELRLLYRHATVTVCPSFYEGFDFSGVEAMRSGGIVVASDIAVHRDVFGDAADYFNPYSEEALAAAVERLLGEEGAARRRELRDAGLRVASRYLPDQVLPQWHEFLHRARMT